jgi:hypothetical protein
MAGEEHEKNLNSKCGDEPEGGQREGAFKRESVVGGVFTTVKHLQEAHATGFSTIRKTDRVSQIMLVVAIGLIAAAQVVPTQQLAVSLIADFMLAAALCVFLALRFGVVRTLLPRQAILVWQLIVGAFLLGLFIAFNLKMFVLLQSGLSLGK